MPLRWRNTTYWVAFDPDVPGLMWGAFSATHDLPRPKMWRRTDPDTLPGRRGRLDRRRPDLESGGNGDAGDRHHPRPRSTPRARRDSARSTPRASAAASSSPPTTAPTWSSKNAGIAAPQPFAWRLTRAGDGTLYLVVARRSERGEIGDARDGALYRSTDGAEHWTRVVLPEGTNGPNGLAVDPKDPRRLYLAAWGRATPGGDTGGGIFVSSDGGADLEVRLPGYQHVYDVTIDPRDPAVLYASGFDQSAFRSADRGETWTRIRGFNFKWGQRVIPDPRRPGADLRHDLRRRRLARAGGGRPDATEDVVPSDRFRSGGR